MQRSQKQRLEALEKQIRPIGSKGIEWDLSILTNDELTQLEQEIISGSPGDICKKVQQYNGLEWGESK